jgi:hypothetical protein
MDTDAMSGSTVVMAVASTGAVASIADSLAVAK